MDAAIKFSVLKVRNLPGRSRRLSASGYVEWVLGDLRPKTAPHITTEVDPYSGALYARNPYNTEFPERVAFFDVDDPNRTGTCDRTEFLGRHGSLGNPAALGRAHLSGKQGSCLDPCAALQVGFTLADGQEREITFRLGLGGVPGGDDANRLVHRFRGPDPFRPPLPAGPYTALVKRLPARTCPGTGRSCGWISYPLSLSAGGASLLPSALLDRGGLYSQMWTLQQQEHRFSV